MNNFKIIKNLPILDLYSEFQRLLDEKIISWYVQPNGKPIEDQICVNTISGHNDDIHLGRGSLIYDWDKFSHDNNGNLHAPFRQQKMQESDFTVLCTQFKNTLFEQMFEEVTKNYQVGRIRIMNSRPKTCLTWHVDNTHRIHYPLKTQEGCLMVIEDEVRHLEKHTWYYTDTLKKHTAFNGSKEERLHLVVSILK